MSLKHGILGTNVVRDRHYVRNPATGRNERALLVEPALTNVVEFNIPGGSAADIEFQQLDAITNLSSEYGMIVDQGHDRVLVMPANFSATSFAFAAWFIPRFNYNDGARHELFDCLVDSSNRILATKKDDNILYVTIVAGGVQYDTSFSHTFTAGTPVFLGARLNSGTLTAYADTNGDGTLETSSVATGALAGGSYSMYLGEGAGGDRQLEGALNLVWTNDGSTAAPITDRFNSGNGLALGGDQGWLAKASGNGSVNGENLVLSVGANADGTALELNTAQGATDLLAGPAQGRYDFDGVDNNVDLGVISGLNGASAAMFSFEIEPDAIAGASRWIYSGGSFTGDYNVMILFESTGHLTVYVSPSGSGASDYKITNAAAITVGERRRFWVRYNGAEATSANRVRIYSALYNSTTRQYGAVAEVASTQVGTIPATLATTTTSSRIGRRIGGPEAFDGKLDDFRIAIGSQFDPTTVSDPINEANPARWTHWYPFDGNANDGIGSRNGTVTGATQVTDGRQHLGRMERFTRQGQYFIKTGGQYLSRTNWQILDGKTAFSFWFVFTPLVTPTSNLAVFTRWDNGDNSGKQFGIDHLTSNTLRFAFATDLSGGVATAQTTATVTIGVPNYVWVRYDGGGGANADRLKMGVAAFDPATGTYGVPGEDTLSFSGTIPASLTTPSSSPDFVIGGWHDDKQCTPFLIDHLCLNHSGALPVGTMSAQSIYNPDTGILFHHGWDFDGDAADYISSADLTVTGAIQWYDGRKPEGWTVASGVEVDRATGTDQSSEGTYGLRVKATSANPIALAGPSTTVGRWGVFVGKARETVAEVSLDMAGSAYAQGAVIPTQATMAHVGGATRAVGTSPVLRVSTSGSGAEAYIDNLRALQLATVSLSVSNAANSMPGIDGRGGAWGVADATVVVASSESIPLPYDLSLGTKIVKLSSGPAGSGVRRYLFGIPGEMNGFTASQVGVLLVGVYIPAASEIGYADVKLRAVDNIGSTNGTAAPGDAEWHWLWVARKWDASATEAYFELRFADGVTLAGANQTLYMALPAAVQGAGIGAPIAKSTEGSSSATAADTAYATSASAALASRTYYLRLFEVGTALAGGTIYHLGSGTAGADPRLVVQGSGGYYRVTFDDGSEEITSTHTVAPTAGQVVELRIVIDATAKTVRLHQAVNHGSEVSATVSSALSGSFPAALAGTRRYFGSEAGSSLGTLVLLNEASFAGDVSLASCRQFAGV